VIAERNIRTGCVRYLLTLIKHDNNIYLPFCQTCKKKNVILKIKYTLTLAHQETSRMTTVHLSWSQLENENGASNLSFGRDAPASPSASSSDADDDDQPRQASPDINKTRIFARPSTSSRALKTFGQVQEFEGEDLSGSNESVVALGRLKTRTQHKTTTTKKKKKKKKKVLRTEKCSEEEEIFEPRAIVTRSPEPPVKRTSATKVFSDEVHVKVSDRSALFRRAKEREGKKTKNDTDIVLIPEEKLEHLLRICREAPDGENWRDKVNALERLSEVSHAFSISRSSSMFFRAIEDGGKHAQDLRACLAKAALKFLRAVCEHCDAQHCVSNSSNALTNLGKCMLKRASDGSAFLKQDALEALRLLRERIGPNAFLKIILAQPSNVNPRVRRTMALCLSEVDDKESKIDRQTIERVIMVKDVMVKDGDAETRAYARKIFSSFGKSV